MVDFFSDTVYMCLFYRAVLHHINSLPTVKDIWVLLLYYIVCFAVVLWECYKFFDCCHDIQISCDLWLVKKGLILCNK